MEPWLKKIAEERKKLVAVDKNDTPIAAPKNELVANAAPERSIAALIPSIAAPIAAPTEPIAAPEHRGKKLPKEIISSIIKHKLSYPTTSNRELARKFGVNEGTIRRLIKEVFP